MCGAAVCNVMQDPVAELFTLQGGAPSAPAPASNAAAEADPFGFAEFSDSTATPAAAAAPPVRIDWHALLFPNKHLSF